MSLVASVGVLDYGVGNTGSVHNMLEYLGITHARVTDDADAENVERLILPGVGAFDAGMGALVSGPGEAVVRKVLDSDRPLLGICLGMQMLTNGSDEGTCEGLGVIRGHCARFDPSGGAKVPHMGWSTVRSAQPTPLLPGGDEPPPRFYFVHSYHVVVEREPDALGLTPFDNHEFVSMISNGDRVFGAQFHPEKSHRSGMDLLRRFASVPG